MAMTSPTSNVMTSLSKTKACATDTIMWLVLSLCMTCPFKRDSMCKPDAPLGSADAGTHHAKRRIGSAHQEEVGFPASRQFPGLFPGLAPPPHRQLFPKESYHFLKHWIRLGAPRQVPIRFPGQLPTAFVEDGSVLRTKTKPVPVRRPNPEVEPKPVTPEEASKIRLRWARGNMHARDAA